MTLDAASLGQRISEARQRAGLTQGGLAAEAGLDRSAVAKVENGSRRVTALELARIATVVGERVESFLRTPVPAIVSHRNMSDPGEPSPRIDAITNRIVEAVEFVAENDDRLREALRELPVHDDPAGPEDAEALARTARKLLGLGNEEPVHEFGRLLAQNAGVLVFACELGSESADATSVLLPAGAVAVVNASLGTGRRRLALAHELGHILVADEYSVDWRVDSSASDQRERMLDRFARALLLPGTAVVQAWRENGGSDRDSARRGAVLTASRFRVDMSTLARRLLDLGEIDGTAAAQIRSTTMTRADIVENDLVVADELRSEEIPRAYAQAVLRLYSSETVSAARAIDLLLDTWNEAELPDLRPLDESATWQLV